MTKWSLKKTIEVNNAVIYKVKVSLKNEDFMSDTVSENAKFNVSKTPDKKTSSTSIKVLVDDYIHKALVPLDPEMDILDAAKLLLKKGLTGLPVIDELNNLVGFLSEKDVLKHAYEAKYNSLPGGTVKKYMTTKLITVELGTEIFDVLNLFIKNQYQVYPVVKQGKFVGIIQRTMALKAILDMKDEIW